MITIEGKNKKNKKNKRNNREEQSERTRAQKHSHIHTRRSLTHAHVLCVHRNSLETTKYRIIPTVAHTAHSTVNLVKRPPIRYYYDCFRRLEVRCESTRGSICLQFCESLVLIFIHRNKFQFYLSIRSRNRNVAAECIAYLHRFGSLSAFCLFHFNNVYQWLAFRRTKNSPLIKMSAEISWQNCIIQ